VQRTPTPEPDPDLEPELDSLIPDPSSSSTEDPDDQTFGPTTPFFEPSFRTDFFYDDDDYMPSVSKEFQDIEKLKDDGSNWRIFEARVIFAAKAMTIEKHLDKTPPTPPTDAEKLKEHNDASRQLLNAIIQKLPNTILTKHLNHDEPNKLWTALKAEFGTHTIAGTASIKAQMFALACSDNGNMRKYIDKMLDFYQQLVDAGSKMEDTRLQDAIIVGARAGGSTYVAVIEAISTSYTAAGKTSKLTSTLFIQSLRSTYDGLQANKIRPKTSTAANWAQSGSRDNSRGDSRGRGRSGNRGRGGPQRNDRANGQSSNKPAHELRCNRCGGLGHWRDACPSPGSVQDHVCKANAAESQPPRPKKDGKKTSSQAAAPATATTATIVEVNAWSATVSASAASLQTPSTLTIFDSGASEHMTPRCDLLTDYRDVPEIAIRAANNSTFAGVGRGTLRIELDTTSGRKKVLLLPDVIYAPGMGATLVSLSKLDSDGLTIRVHAGTMRIYGHNGRLAGTIPNMLLDLRHPVNAPGSR
jgi:hypothetical protein